MKTVHCYIQSTKLNFLTDAESPPVFQTIKKHNYLKPNEQMMFLGDFGREFFDLPVAQFVTFFQSNKYYIEMILEGAGEVPVDFFEKLQKVAKKYAHRHVGFAVMPVCDDGDWYNVTFGNSEQPNYAKPINVRLIHELNSLSEEDRNFVLSEIKKDK